MEHLLEFEEFKNALNEKKLSKGTIEAMENQIVAINRMDSSITDDDIKKLAVKVIKASGIKIIGKQKKKIEGILKHHLMAADTMIDYDRAMEDIKDLITKEY